MEFQILWLFNKTILVIYDGPSESGSFFILSKPGLTSFLPQIYSVVPFAHPGPLHKISSQSLQNILSDVANKQTKQHHQKYNLLGKGGNYMSEMVLFKDLHVNTDSSRGWVVEHRTPRLSTRVRASSSPNSYKAD